MKYSIIVLCGGLGTRLPSYANSRGKILAPIGSKLFIDYFLKWLNVNNDYISISKRCEAYSSDTNPEKLSVRELKKLIKDYKFS